MAQDRAGNLLKQEKNKNDKLSRQAKENQEQNVLLQMRLNELKEEKEKEVGEVRSQYNKIKQEVRSYERILPTHTFLEECGKKIEELPTYEDIFVNLKEKVTQFQQLQEKFKGFKEKSEEEMVTLRQNEEMMRERKM